MIVSSGNVGAGLQTCQGRGWTIGAMKNPIKLVIDERPAGSFLWTLLECDADGAAHKVLRAAEYASDSYEAALAAGTRIMDGEIRRNAARGRAATVG